MLAMVMEVMMSYFGMICNIFEKIILDRKKIGLIRDSFKVILRSFGRFYKIKKKKNFWIVSRSRKKNDTIRIQKYHKDSIKIRGLFIES